MITAEMAPASPNMTARGSRAISRHRRRGAMALARPGMLNLLAKFLYPTAHRFEPDMKLYSYFRSSAAYRMRIALALKGLSYDAAYVHLRKKEHKAEAYTALNPQGLVPALIDDDGSVVTQSMAIIEYLDETRPDPPLMPKAPLDRARVRSIAQLIGCEMHPLNNLRVLQYLKNELGHDDETRDRWYLHWVKEGFDALEKILAQPETGRFCHGDSPTLADICLVPQVFNAERFGADITAYPRIGAVREAMMALPALKGTAPAEQPDAEA